MAENTNGSVETSDSGWTIWQAMEQAAQPGEWAELVTLNKRGLSPEKPRTVNRILGNHFLEGYCLDERGQLHGGSIGGCYSFLADELKERAKDTRSDRELEEAYRLACRDSYFARYYASRRESALWKSLRRKLESGEYIAVGRLYSRTGEIRPIPPSAYGGLSIQDARMSIFQEKNATCLELFDVKIYPSGTGPHAKYFLPPPVSGATRKSNIEVACTNELLRIYQQNPARRLKKLEVWVALTENGAQFKNILGWNQFCRAWQKFCRASECGWEKPGPPRKNLGNPNSTPNNRSAC